MRLPKVKLPVVAEPAFEPGPGERHDCCTGYTACLEKAARLGSRWASSLSMQCPKGCTGYQRRDARADIDDHAGSRPGGVTW